MLYKENGNEKILLPMYVMEMELLPFTRAIYIRICYNVQKSADGYHTETQVELANIVRCSTRQVTRSLKELVENNLIIIEKIGVRYRITTTDKFD